MAADFQYLFSYPNSVLRLPTLKEAASCRDLRYALPLYDLPHLSFGKAVLRNAAIRGNPQQPARHIDVGVGRTSLKLK